MAQLTDDCFAFSGPLLPLDDMERLIGERVAPVAETEHVPLRGACGRVTAADIKAPVDLPPFDNSAVDGYAVRHADLRADGDSTLTIAGRLTAGARTGIALEPGQAIRIFTGAAMPAGADTVFMQEDVTVDGDHVIVPKGLKLGANRRLAGEDLPAGRGGAAGRHGAGAAAYRARRRARHHQDRGAPPAEGRDLLHRRRGGGAGRAARRRRHL